MTTTWLKRGFKRGDVVLVLYPESNLQAAQPRPALVVQADHLETHLSQVIIAMISSKMYRAGHPSRVVITLDSSEGKHSGLLKDSVVMTDNLATVETMFISRVIGSLPMERIDAALKHTLGL